MKLVQINDSHIRGTSPRSRGDDYSETLYQKFCELGEFIKKNKVEAVLNGGDLFDTPDPSTGIVNKYLELFMSWGIPIYSIIGSHDKFGYNNATIGRTALGTLHAAGVVTFVSDIVSIGEGTSICGVSHSYSLDENPETDYFFKKTSDDYLIQLCHGMITEGTFYGKHTVYDQIRTEADLVICGHYHPGFGPFAVGNSTVINIGSMGRTENTTRKYPPGFMFIDSASRTWEFIKFESAPLDPFIEKSTDLPKIDPYESMQEFMNTLKTRVKEFGTHDLKSVLHDIGVEKKFPQHIIERAQHYVENS